MGVGVAHVFAVHGIETVLVDASPAQAEAGLGRALELLDRLVDGGCVTAEQQSLAAGCLSADASFDAAAARADLVVEAVYERADVKHDVYQRVESVASESAVIATNTSSIPIAQLASGLRHPQRFLGVHWFVPPLLVPCVEVIPAPATSERVVADVVAVLERLGKSPVTVGDGPGFVANRIQFAMFAEAARIVEAGLATPEQVDEVVRSSFGFRLPFFGPFTIADMAGLDVYSDIFETLESGLGESFRPPAVLSEHVARGEFGVKTGSGFLTITQDEAAELVERRDRAYLALSALRHDLEEPASV